MKDLITIEGLSATGYHGVLPEERRNGQVFVVDVVLSTDVRDAAAKDDLDFTVDYSAVAVSIVDIIEGEPFDLIETLAERMAQHCLTVSKVQGARVTVHKPQAPVGVEFSDVAVTVERERGA